ncbi:hypothetical protein K458DRAFT_391191 [Lentithecium fluviatile CBS 122367]|uniref:Uncharacterized protein n=1 Tax=Lentithecium fluviatile CBS 122367 TaxID=1168545 RepID=A0A6G1IW97_9PLEO|nr:hypothetical protein K458DRAFT_391191 [Lentithecium fluviatile CBS 122367]
MASTPHPKSDSSSSSDLSSSPSDPHTPSPVASVFSSEIAMNKSDEPNAEDFYTAKDIMGHVEKGNYKDQYDAVMSLISPDQITEKHLVDSEAKDPSTVLISDRDKRHKKLKKPFNGVWVPLNADHKCHERRVQHLVTLAKCFLVRSGKGNRLEKKGNDKLFPQLKELCQDVEKYRARYKPRQEKMVKGKKAPPGAESNGPADGGAVANSAVSEILLPMAVILKYDYVRSQRNSLLIHFFWGPTNADQNANLNKRPQIEEAELAQWKQTAEKLEARYENEKEELQKELDTLKRRTSN